MNTHPEDPALDPAHDTGAAAVALGHQQAYEEPYDPVFEEVENPYRQAINAKAKRDMLFGALWCIGGTVATLADTGFIFWGAIVFGGIQFFRGVSNYDR